MFLKTIINKNPNLIKTAVNLHQSGLIPANSYLLDIDTFKENALIMKNEADKLGLKLFPMLKQLGRNIVAMQALKEWGIDSGVCVDMADARRAYSAGMEIGHLGHLVQVPFAEVKAAIDMNPMYWTVYSIEKAKEIADALPVGKKQKILLRIYDGGDIFYKGHEGGFRASDVVKIANEIEAMRGLEVAGLTTFPTQLYNEQKKIVEHTHNYTTLLNAAKALKNAGWQNLEINAPGTTSVHLFAEMAELGVTQVEPGHGLTGTTPIHARKDMVENPAICYVSEVSHFYQGKAYCFGGGMYIDPVFGEYEVKACVGNQAETILSQLVSCEIPAPQAIDYYGILEKDEMIKCRDTVVFGYRIQAFVTRAFVVPVSGIRSGKPVVEGIFDSDGKEMRWPAWENNRNMH